MFQWTWLLRRVLDKLNFGLSETRIHSKLDGQSTFSPVGWLHNLVHDNLQEGQAMFPGWHGWNLSFFSSVHTSQSICRLLQSSFSICSNPHKKRTVKSHVDFPTSDVDDHHPPATPEKVIFHCKNNQRRSIQDPFSQVAQGCWGTGPKKSGECEWVLVPGVVLASGGMGNDIPMFLIGWRMA